MLGKKLLLTEATTDHHFKAARALFAEYAKTPGFAEAYSGNYAEELANLQREYAPPDGRLYLVFTGGQPAGCLAMRRFDEQRCEMRRLFVRPEFRGQHVGVVLVRQLLHDARESGYKSVILSSLESMKTAHALFRRVGFKRISQPLLPGQAAAAERAEMAYFEKLL